jgi:hypothetical protein
VAKCTLQARACSAGDGGGATSIGRLIAVGGDVLRQVIYIYK